MKTATFDLYMIEKTFEAFSKEAQNLKSPKSWSFNPFFSIQLKRANKRIITQLNHLKSVADVLVVNIDRLSVHEATNELSIVKEVMERITQVKEDYVHHNFPKDTGLQTAFKETLKSFHNFEDVLNGKINQVQPSLKTNQEGSNMKLFSTPSNRNFF